MQKLHLLLSKAKVHRNIEIFSIFLINITRTTNNLHRLVGSYLVSKIFIQELPQQIKFVMKCTMIRINLNSG